MSIPIKQINTITVQDFDELVRSTYNRPYSFQQQDGCKDRGLTAISVPSAPKDYEDDSVPEIVNHQDMGGGVSFSAWLARDPEQLLPGRPNETSALALWWYRNFYPHISMIINDLHSKGLLPAGDYFIDIDW